MDLHKPKPWHGLREFLKEYLIIVVGVLTALAAEAGVEWLHWRHQVAQSDEALLAETRFNLWSGYERIVLAPCHRERLVELRELLLKPGPDWKGAALPGSQAPVAEPARTGIEQLARLGSAASPITTEDASAMSSAYSTPTRPWDESAWSAAVASGVFNHMDRGRAAAYGHLYRGFQLMKDQQAAELTAKARLAVLAYDRTLTEAQRTEFLQTVSALNYANLNMERMAAQLLLEANAQGIRVKGSDAKGLLDRLAGTARAACYQRVAIPMAPG